MLKVCLSQKKHLADFWAEKFFLYGQQPIVQVIDGVELDGILLRQSTRLSVLISPDLELALGSQY